MRAMRNNILLVSVLVICLMVFGCGKKNDGDAGTGDSGSGSAKVGIDLKASISDLTSAANDMSKESLEKIAALYKSKIEAMKPEMDKLGEDLMKQMDNAKDDLGISNVMEAADGASDKLDAMSKKMEDLLARYKVYYDKLKAMGVDVSSLEIKDI